MFHPFRLACIIAITTLAGSAAEEQWRIWTSSSGTVIEGLLTSHTADTVTMKSKDTGRLMTVKLAQLSVADREYLAARPPAPAAELPLGTATIPGLDAQPGTISGKIPSKDGKWTYRLYLPKAFQTNRPWPVWFIMAPGGGEDGSVLNRYIDGAERLGCVLALSVESKNDFADSDLAMEAMTNDVYDRLPVSKELGFASGMSGGSRMAYLLAERDTRIAGVLACGSGGGVYLKEKDFRAAKLRKTTYIYSLMGTNCFNRDEAVRSHDGFPENFRLHFFPGGHDWAEAPLIGPGMARVYGEALKKTTARELDPLRQAYSTAMAKWMDELAKDEPWEAARWAEFLTTFPADATVKNHAAKVTSELSRNPQLALARQAEKDISKFAKKHYNKNISGDEESKPVPSRESEAAKLAEKYPDIPHAEILKRLAKPS